MANRIIVNLDTSKSQYNIFECKQNDDLILEANIFENGISKDLTNAEITINCTRADGTYVIQNTDITKEGKKLIANLKRDFTRIDGLDKFEVVLLENEKQNTTFDFNILVKPSVLKTAIEESKDTVIILEELGNKIVEAGQVKEETEQLIATGGAATKGDIEKVNSSLEHIAKFSNVEEMKNANCPLGAKVKTIGYYNLFDNGGAEYTIDNEDNGIGILLNNGLYANFVGDKITSKQLGCNNDSTQNFKLLSKLSNWLKESYTFELLQDLKVKMTDKIPDFKNYMIQIKNHNVSLISNNFGIEYDGEYDFSVNGGLVLIGVIGVAFSKIKGFNFKANTKGYYYNTEGYGTFGCIYYEANQEGIYASEYILEDCKFTLHHPDGCTIEDDSVTGTKPGDAHLYKIIPALFNGNYNSGKEGMSPTRGGIVKGCEITKQSNSYCFWSFGAEVDFIDNTIHVNSIRAGIRYHMTDNMSPIIKNNRFIHPQKTNDESYTKGFAYCIQLENKWKPYTLINLNVKVTGNYFMLSNGGGIYINGKSKGIDIDNSNYFTEYDEISEDDLSHYSKNCVFVTTANDGLKYNSINGTMFIKSNRVGLGGTNVLSSENTTILNTLDIRGGINVYQESRFRKDIIINTNKLKTEGGSTIGFNGDEEFEINCNGKTLYVGRGQGMVLFDGSKYNKIDLSSKKVCTSSTRPSDSSVVYDGFTCFDSTLKKNITYYGGKWYADGVEV